MHIELRKSHLRVISTTLTNIGSGLLLAPPLTVKNIAILILSLMLAILLLLLAAGIEEVIDTI